MSDFTPSASDLSMEGETLANDYHWRSTKAKKQLRDRFGRWISLGANVRFRGDGAEQAGVVTSVVDGKAYVDQKNRDGTVTQKVIDPGAIRVIASKATLPPDSKKIFDKENNFYTRMESPEYKAAMAEKGEALIERADGYSLSARTDNDAQGTDNKILDGTEPHEDKTGGNPILYQLFAPGGRSLGTYSKGAEADFDGMVADDQEAKEAPTGGNAPTAEPSPTDAPEAPIAASLSSDIVVSGASEKTFRVPESVKSLIAFSLEHGDITKPLDKEFAHSLAYNDSVTLAEVQWINSFFEAIQPQEQLRGGYEGRKWATKIVSPSAPVIASAEEEVGHPKYYFDDDTFAYFAVGKDAGSTLVHQLLSVDYETGAVYHWTPEGFCVIESMDITDVDEPQLIPIDEMTADEFAHWIDSGTVEEFDILDTDPEERNLFTLADSEIDYDELDRAFSIIAAGESYTPVERSQNAKVQRRGAGGKFGDAPDAPAAVPESTEEPKVQKAKLPMELPLVENPAARIAEWLSTASEAPVVAAGDPEAVEGNPANDQALEDSATGPTNEALYFAIVDEVDKTAVLDAVAIVKTNGTPSTFLRTGGEWVANPDTLADLQGSTPPPVVELDDPATVKTVLAQIDAHDSGVDTTPVPETAPAPQAAPAPVAASGYALADGSYTIIDVEDLQNAVVASAGTSDLFVKAHIRKRARALNRMDVVPEAWREFTLAEIGELSAAQTVYGEFGEIIVAAGIPGIADAPSDFKNVAKLQNYWTRGKGALKIRWGTKGDLTRAHRHLSKYVGPQRAWGLAQKYHRSLFGVYNHTHDVATGQYVPRKRK